MKMEVDLPICDFPGCGQRFAKKHRLKNHRFVHFPAAEKPFKCDVSDCSAAYARNAHLQRHKNLTHGKPEGPIKCKIEGCVATFHSEFEHKQHANRAHFQRTTKTKFTCSISNCQRVFTKLYNLQEHEASHTGVKPFKCDYCLEEFYIYSKFKSHISTHQKEIERKKQVSCSHCSQAFATFKGYFIHKKLKHPVVHKCGQCNLTFSSGAQLRSHTSTHSEIRTVFKCPIESCGKVYYYEKGLICHYESRHEGKSYACKFCDKKLCSMQKLKHHLTLHDGIPKAPRLPPPVRRDTIKDFVRKRLKNGINAEEMFNYRKPGPKRKQSPNISVLPNINPVPETDLKVALIEGEVLGSEIVKVELHIDEISPCLVVEKPETLES